MENTSHAPEVPMFQIGAKVTFTAGPHKGHTGTVTAIKGPKTREVRDDRGFMHWNVKIANMQAAE